MNKQPAFASLRYRNRSTVLASRHANMIAHGGNAMFRSLHVLHRQVVESGKALRKKTLHLTWEPFGKLKKVDKQAFDKAADRYTAFLDLSLEQ